MVPLKLLKGIGPASIKYLKEAGIDTISGLLNYFPRAYEYRDTIENLSDARNASGDPVQLAVAAEVTGFSWFGFGRKKTLKIHIRDSSDEAVLVCFGRNFLLNNFTEGKKYFFYGTFSLRFGEIQCSSFEYETYSDSPKLFNRIIPVYPLTSQLTQGFLRKIIRQAIETEGRYEANILPEDLIARNNLFEKSEALKNIHFPDSRESLSKALYTLKYEEFFLFQKNIIQHKRERESKKRKPGKLKRERQRKTIEALPFPLTEDQKKAVEDIYADSLSEYPMARILQGDVGCGKTVVGFLSSLPYIESGMQAAFMAPTELLARQHLESASKLLSGTGTRIAYLSGKLPEKKKKLVREALSAGEIDLLIGTHALLSEPVAFRNLGLAIVDEQHKFGVAQRSALAGKGENTDFLMMTATPIPRTLQMTFFGDISVSTIKSMPGGRAPVRTHTVYLENIEKVYAWVRKELEAGFQAYFVYPLIEESETLNLKNAEAMFAHLDKNIFPEWQCAMLHSRLPEDTKEKVMKDFSTGTIRILAATSVVEVGIDVPRATCMVIEHAERFSLTALHQLRGRIGRSSYQSYAFLVFNRELTDVAKARLRVIKENSDGFVIAEEDLKLRGPGDVAGLRQSGFADFRLADIIKDKEILEAAVRDASEASI